MDRWHTSEANLLFQFSSALLYARLLFENTVKLAVNHHWMHFLESLRERVWVSVSSDAFWQCLRHYARMNDARRSREKRRRAANKRQRRVLTVCCHPAWRLLLCVCMVLTSSVAKFCQVWSGLTFSLSRHVYSSPIAIKISNSLSLCLSLSVSLSSSVCF